MDISTNRLVAWPPNLLVRGRTAMPHAAHRSRPPLLTDQLSATPQNDVSYITPGTACRAFFRGVQAIDGAQSSEPIVGPSMAKQGHVGTQLRAKGGSGDRTDVGSCHGNSRS